MLRRTFQILAIVGIAVICIIAFVVPSNPNQIIPSLTLVSFDKPLWLCIIIGGGFIYLISLYSIYDRLNNK